jgi:hypothetical protein
MVKVMVKPAHRKLPKLELKPRRNNALFDTWSIVHCSTGVLMGWIIDPFVAVSLMVLWEPFEILILSPFLARYNIVFGYETLRNSLSDIFFDVVGVAMGTWVVARFITAPFHLF